MRFKYKVGESTHASLSCALAKTFDKRIVKAIGIAKTRIAPNAKPCRSNAKIKATAMVALRIEKMVNRIGLFFVSY